MQNALTSALIHLFSYFFRFWNFDWKLDFAWFLKWQLYAIDRMKSGSHVLYFPAALNIILYYRFILVYYMMWKKHKEAQQNADDNSR
jgi:hypothetical protein